MNFIFRVECDYCKKDVDLSSTNNFDLMQLMQSVKADKTYCSEECQVRGNKGGKDE